ncbi:PREDICTED: uncharacterized protein C9orf131 homolog [Hipposideros armiger]|uniref:Uncharacterized protein C9orf131 homolog n=1 Tax=Hipposideros armiger TaxID=186990 RepID=A0A8B7T2Q2_HIPAR|nr:PREDICTED: uncharacterized protein C9orf131 homolog [Hipposideros armiger]
MEWLLEGILGAMGDKGFLWGQLTHALACRYCGSSCLQSTGNLVTLFLFMVWQIRRWWQLGSWRQLLPWYSWDMMQGKGLPLLYRVAFLDRLWKQKSEGEEKEEEEEEKEEEEETYLDPCSLPKEAPIREQATIAPSQPFCSSKSLHKAVGTPELVLMQTPSPSRSFPTFQILTNLPVKHKTASGSHVHERKGQLFWGLPSLHSESLEAIILSSGGASPLKLPVVPSICFNKLAFLYRSNLLLPQYCSPTQLPTHEVHTMEDLQEIAPDPQQLPPRSSPSVPSLLLHLVSFPMDHKRVLCGAEAHIQWLTQQKEVPWVSADQALHPDPKLQRPFSKVWWGEPRDPDLQQHIPGSLSASLLHPSSLLGVLTRSEAPWRTMGQNEDPKALEPATPVPSPTLASLPLLQGISCIGGLSGSKDLWETTRQRENRQISGPPILVPCQSVAPMTEPQKTSPLGVPPGCETQWKTIGHKESPQASEPPMPAPCQLPDSLSEPQKVSPEGRPSVPKHFWGTMGHGENPQTSGSPIPVPCTPPDSLPELWGGRENSGNPAAFEPPALDLNQGLYGTSSACVPSRSVTLWKSMQSRDNLWVSADPVSSSSLSSASLLESLQMGPQGVLSESKALWEESMGQKENLWTSKSPAPAHSRSLPPILDPHRINPVGELTKSEAAWKDIEHSRNSWASKPPSLALSPHLGIILEPLRVSPVGILSDSEASCGDIQRTKNSWAFEFPAHSLPQDPHETSPLGVLSDSEPVAGDMEQKEICCVPVSPFCGPSPSSNSMSKSHVSEPIGDESNCQPEGETVEQRENYWATELPAPTFSSLSAPLPEPHLDLEFVWRHVPQREVPQGSSPPSVDPLQPISWPPLLAEALKIEPSQPGLPKGELFPGAKAETPPSQREAVPEVPTHSEIHAWNWSRELELRLKKLQLSPTSRSLCPSQSFGSSPALSNTSPGTWRHSSCSPQQTHPPKLCPHSSSCHPPKVESTLTQPVQISHCCHSSAHSQPQGSGRAKQGSHRGERTKAKMVAQVSPQGPYVHMEADKNCPGLGELSNSEVPVSGNRQDKASALSSLKRQSLRKPKAGDHSGGDARLRSPTVTGKSHPVQAGKLVGAPARLSQRSQHRNQSCLHTALPQQLHSKDGGPQDKQGELGAGDILTPQQCQHCPWAHLEKHLSSPTSQAPLSKGLQRMLTKFLGIQGPLPTISSQQRKGW